MLDEKRVRASFKKALEAPLLSADYVQNFMRRLRFDGISGDDRMILSVQTPFFRDFIAEHYIGHVLTLMENDIGQRLKVEWRVDPAMNQPTQTNTAPALGAPKKSGTSQAPRPSEPQGSRADEHEFQNLLTPTPPPANTLHPVAFRDIFNRLNDNYRFDNFVSAPSNQLAFAGAKALAQSSATALNPLFIYGGSGLGKTHLLHSIGHLFLEIHPGAKVIYMTSDELTNDFIGSLTNKRMPEFRKRMREDCDCLLIDDIQSLTNREGTQDEFFNIFNALHSMGKPVAMTSDRIPAEIKGIPERLRTRFVSGLMADIQEPDFETRVAILKKKAEGFTVQLPDEVARYIARVVLTNVRELEGALKRVFAVQSLTQQPMTEEMAAHTLENVLPKQKKLGVEDVQKEISKYYNVSVESLISPKRQRNIVKARQMAMYIARKLTGTSYPELGKLFHRDHTTALTSCEKIEEALENDESIRNELEEIMSRLGANAKKEIQEIKMDEN